MNSNDLIAIALVFIIIGAIILSIFLYQKDESIDNSLIIDAQDKTIAVMKEELELYKQKEYFKKRRRDIWLDVIQEQAQKILALEKLRRDKAGRFL